MHFLNSCVLVASFEVSTLGVCHPSSMPSLLDATLAQPDIFAVVNCADVALSVSYSRFNVLLDICAVANCSVLVLSAVLLRSRNLER